jgi:hypothetical protein
MTLNLSANATPLKSPQHWLIGVGIRGEVSTIWRPDAGFVACGTTGTPARAAPSGWRAPGHLPRTLARDGRSMLRDASTYWHAATNRRDRAAPTAAPRAQYLPLSALHPPNAGGTWRRWCVDDRVAVGRLAPSIPRMRGTLACGWGEGGSRWSWWASSE